MPWKLWKVKLYCPHEGCDRQPLTSAGMYRTVRQVLEIDSKCNLAAEYLDCTFCQRKVISWSPEIVKQIDVAHQPVEKKGLGKTTTQLQKKLTQ